MESLDTYTAVKGANDRFAAQFSVRNGLPTDAGIICKYRIKTPRNSTYLGIDQFDLDWHEPRPKGSLAKSILAQALSI